MKISRRRLVVRILIVLAVLAVPPAVIIGRAVMKVRSTLLRSVPAPESPSGLRAVPQTLFPHAAVVASHPEAARIGAEVLAAGGSAIDAAVAVQATLTLVEPQASGIGGGAFLLYYDGPTQKLSVIDGRETAPASATPGLFLNSKGKPLSFPQALLGGQSVGVPGVVSALALAHGRYGRKTWAELFEKAAELAEIGFTVTPRLSVGLDLDPALPAMDATRAYFYPGDGWPVATGSTLVNKPLAQTLRAIGNGGAAAFYTGPIASQIVEAVHGAKRPSMTRGAFNLVARQWGLAANGTSDVDAPGGLSLADLAGYRAVERDPICVVYRRFRVCTAPPPSGGATVLQTLRMLERFDLKKLGPGVESAHLMTEAQAIAESDRQRWSADPAFAAVPTAGLLDEPYLAGRGREISIDRTLPPAVAGLPPGATAQTATGEAFELPSTSHFAITDRDGSIVSMTTSIEFQFGSHVMAGGFLINNQLTDFAFTPETDGKRVFNAVEAGKRPRSAMSPVIVFDHESGRPLFAVGSPGGPRIIAYVIQTLVGVLDFGLDLNHAIAAPHVLSVKGELEVEDLGWPDEASRDRFVEGLRARGHKVSVAAANSGIHGLALTPDGIVPGIDPRREGDAQGD